MGVFGRTCLKYPTPAIGGIFYSVSSGSGLGRASNTRSENKNLLEWVVAVNCFWIFCGAKLLPRVSLTDWRHVSKKKHRHITFCPNWPKRMPNERSHQELSHDVLKNKIQTFLNELWPKTRCQYFDPFGDPPQKNLTIWRTSFRLVNLVPH